MARRQQARKEPAQQEQEQQETALVTREQELARREQALAERERTTLDVTPVERSSTALAQRARTEVEAAYELALKFPRDLDDMATKLTRSCRNPAFAEQALYTIERGSNKISGPSIRFAEECLRLYRNVKSTRRMVYDGENSRTIVVALTDLENNITVEQELEISKVVERRFPQKGDQILGKRPNSRGEDVFQVRATMDDMRMKEGAEVARARRNLILEVIPSWITRDAREHVERTLAQGYKDDPDGTTKRLLQGFADRGIAPSHVKEYLGREEVGRLSKAEYDELRGVMVALIEGGVTWGELVEQKAQARGGGEAEKKPEAAAAIAKLRERGAAAIAQQKEAEKKPAEGEVQRDDPKAVS